jgi:Pyruvate/2-oxoacid:ferredoxin oxidoreductase delta subunit
MHPLPYKDLSDFVRSYSVDGNCTGYGICKKLCPAKSVETANNKAQSGSSGRNRGQTSQSFFAKSYNVDGNCAGYGICRELCPTKNVQFGR